MCLLEYSCNCINVGSADPVRSVVVKHVLSAVKVNIVLFNIHYSHKRLTYSCGEKKDKFLWCRILL